MFSFLAAVIYFRLTLIGWGECAVREEVQIDAKQSNFDNFDSTAICFRLESSVAIFIIFMK